MKNLLLLALVFVACVNTETKDTIPPKVHTIFNDSNMRKSYVDSFAKNDPYCQRVNRQIEELKEVNRRLQLINKYYAREAEYYKYQQEDDCSGQGIRIEPGESMGFYTLFPTFILLKDTSAVILQTDTLLKRDTL